MKTSLFHALRPMTMPSFFPLLLALGISSPRAFAAPSSGVASAQKAWLDPMILGVSSTADESLIAQLAPPVAAPLEPALRNDGTNDAGHGPSTDSTSPRGNILLNFQNASLADVLTYLSQEAEFIIVQEAQVSGTVNIVSRQPLSPDDAVDLLNTVLADKGLTAARANRVLRIIDRSKASRYNVPVNLGANPEHIPESDAVETRILPLHYGEAAKLVENLRPLLADSAYISANEGSNAIILVDTQTNIRRIAKIIRALDTSVSSISSLRVFELKFADSKALADIITQLFSAPANNNNNSNNNNNRGGQGGRGGGSPGFGGPGGGNQPQAAQSEALKAAVRVVAVADEQSNSLIVGAPDELMPNIKDMIDQLDKTVIDVTETRIFKLQNADSVELADTINNLYGDATTNQNAQNNRGGQQQQRQIGFPGQQQPAATASSATSQRSLLQSKVNAVGDPRTNSLIITASHDTMPQIAQTIGQLDMGDAKKQRTYILKLSYADVDSVADVLRGMTGGQVQNTPATSALVTRQTSGAALDTTSFSTSNTGAAGASSGR